MDKKIVFCHAEATLTVIGGRWKALILQQLFDGVKRFNELHRALAGITHKTLLPESIFPPGVPRGNVGLGCAPPRRGVRVA